MFSDNVLLTLIHKKKTHLQYSKAWKLTAHFASDLAVDSHVHKVCYLERCGYSYSEMFCLQ